LQRMYWIRVVPRALKSFKFEIYGKVQGVYLLFANEFKGSEANMGQQKIYGGERFLWVSKDG